MFIFSVHCLILRSAFLNETNTVLWCSQLSKQTHSIKNSTFSHLKNQMWTVVVFSYTLQLKTSQSNWRSIFNSEIARIVQSHVFRSKFITHLLFVKFCSNFHQSIFIFLLSFKVVCSQVWIFLWEPASSQFLLRDKNQKIQVKLEKVMVRGNICSHRASLGKQIGSARYISVCSSPNDISQIFRLNMIHSTIF